MQERHSTGRHVGHGETGRVHAIDLHRTIDRTRCREGQDIRGVEIGIADISSRQSNTRAFDNRCVQITGQRRSIILNQDLDCHGNRRALQTVVGGIGQRGRSRRIARKGDGIASAGRSANEACGVERADAECRQRSIRVDVVGKHIQLRGRTENHFIGISNGGRRIGYRRDVQLHRSRFGDPAAILCGVSEACRAEIVLNRREVQLAVKAQRHTAIRHRDRRPASGDRLTIDRRDEDRLRRKFVGHIVCGHVDLYRSVFGQGRGIVGERRPRVAVSQ